MNWFGKRTHWIGAGLVLLVTQVVYLKTMVISCPFWDSGEFIATTYILGIPHPPGNPLYMLIGRLFTLLPIFPLVATRVNWLSTVGASLAAMFTYLVTVELWERARANGGVRGDGGEVAVPRAPSGEGAGEPAGIPWVPFFAGLVAAFFTAFGPTFWINATEAETYSTSSFLMVFAVWLILRWGRPGGVRSDRNGLFLLLYYLMCLSMAIYLGTPLVMPGIILFAFLVDSRVFGRTRLIAGLVAALIILIHPGLLPNLGVTFWGLLIAGVLLSALLFGRKWPAVSGRGVVLWCLLVALIGLSTHFYLMIRAGFHPPAINEADPKTWHSLWMALTRDQYKPPNPFQERQAPWSVQLTRHFWQYTRGQYDLGLRPEWLGWYLPYLLGLGGLIWHWRREKKGFAMLFVNYLVMTLGLVFYLNFRTEEVRDRDYFFVGSFQFFPIWIGLGAAALIEGLRQSLRERWTLVGAGVVLTLLPFLTCRHYWFTHDRTDFYVARDFAYNMLTPLKPNAIIFTNGDNDTFPLWYLQEVEHLRRDVRVANLSLLNTDWYIKQLRDRQPKIDVGWTDPEIDNAVAFAGYMEAYRRGYIDRSEMERFVREADIDLHGRTLNQPLQTKDLAVAQIVAREYGKRPLYIALTVPDQMGLGKRLVQEGIVFEVEDVSTEDERVDLAATVQDLDHVYRYQGLLRSDGSFDDSVYKDDNAMKLVQNYAAAYIEAGREALRENQEPEADRLLNRAAALAPDSPPILYSIAMLKMDMGQWTEAEKELQGLVDKGVVDYRLYDFLGEAQEAQSRLAEAEENYRRAVAAAPNSFDPVRDLFALNWQAKKDYAAALSVLDSWLAKHPDDQKIKRVRQLYADSAALLTHAR